LERKVGDRGERKQGGTGPAHGLRNTLKDPFLSELRKKGEVYLESS